MTIRHGGDFPPQKNASGRRERYVPKVENKADDDEGDGIISPSARYSARIFAYPIFFAFVGYWLYELLRLLVGAYKPGVAIIIFCAFLGFIFWLWKKIFPLFTQEEPRK